VLSRGKLIAVALIALFIVGFVFLRGPIPHIAIKPETLFDLGPISVTNTMLTSWLVVISLIVLVLLATRRWDIVPSGVQNFVEAAVEAFYNLVVNVAGEKNSRRFFPVVATIFFFVLAFNWFSLLPIFNVVGQVHEQEAGFVFEKTAGFNVVPLSSLSALSGDSIDEGDANAKEHYEKVTSEGKKVGELAPFLRGPNTDLNTPLALAIISAIFVEAWGISSLGLFRYLGKFFRPGLFLKGLIKFKPGMVIEGVIEGFVGFLEFVSEVVRLLSFTARLFGNMFAGEVVILMFIFLAPGVLPVIFYGLELFVGIIQAFIFAMLTLVFGVMAVTSHEAHEAEEKHAGADTHGAVLEGALQEPA
jgi:F-type H+-transporting ATPase subunit a